MSQYTTYFSPQRVLLIPLYGSSIPLYGSSLTPLYGTVLGVHHVPLLCFLLEVLASPVSHPASYLGGIGEQPSSG
jgi:hypothetical protein